MPTREDFQHQMALKVKEWGAEIERLRAQAAGDRVGVAKAAAESRFDQQVERLDATRRALHDRVEALRTIGRDDLAVARAEVEKAAATLKRDLDAALAHRRQGPRDP
jgi:hypothetical protein